MANNANSQNLACNRLLAGKSQLLRAVLSGATLIDLVKLGEHLLGRPLALSSENHLVWYASETMPKNAVLPQKAGLSINIRLLEEALGSNFMDLDNPFSICAIDDNHYCLCALCAGGRPQGYSSTLSSTALNADEIALQQSLSAILASEIEKQEARDKALSLSREESLLLRLLENSSGRLCENASTRHLGLVPESKPAGQEIVAERPQERAGILTQPDGSFDMSEARELISFSADYMQIIVVSQGSELNTIPPDLSVIEALREVLESDICFGYRGDLVALAKKNVAFARRQTLDVLLAREQLFAGISYPFIRLDAFRSYYQQACFASEFSYQEGQPKALFYSECVFFEIAREYRWDYSAAVLCNPDIKYIAEYDQKNQTYLAKTLMEYQKSNMNVRATAEQLGVHRNTVLARLGKIQDICPYIDLSSVDDYFSLVLQSQFEAKQQQSASR